MFYVFCEPCLLRRLGCPRQNHVFSVRARGKERGRAKTGVCVPDENRSCVSASVSGWAGNLALSLTAMATVPERV